MHCSYPGCVCPRCKGVIQNKLLLLLLLFPNATITMTLVVSETQQVLQRLNLDTRSFISAGLIRHRFKQENFMSRCCINFTLQLLQLKHISDPSVFKATNSAVEIRLNNSDRFLYMQHISDHHLSIYLISSNHLLKHNLSFIYPC